MLPSCFFIYFFLSHRPILNHNDRYSWLFSYERVLFYFIHSKQSVLRLLKQLCAIYILQVKM